MNKEIPTNSNNLGSAAIGATAQTKDRIAESAHKGIDAASRAVHPTVDRAAAGAHKAVDNADDMVNQAAEAFDRAGVKGEEMLTASTTYMRAHPLLTLSLAVTAGYVLSRLLASR